MDVRRRRPTRFLEGLLWSLGFHLSLLSVLSVKTFLVPKEIPHREVDIQLDINDDSFMATHDLSSNSMREKNALLTSYSIQYEPFVEAALLQIPPATTTNIKSPLVRLYSTPSMPWKPEEALQYTQTRIYPLKLSLQYGLSQAHLIDDGSSFFVPATDKTLAHTPLFAKHPYKVLFLVNVDVQSGKITKIRCDRPLEDKEFQKVAIKFLSMLRFAPKEASEEIHGEIVLQFSGSYSEIEPLVRKEYIL